MKKTFLTRILWKDVFICRRLWSFASLGASGKKASAWKYGKAVAMESGEVIRTDEIIVMKEDLTIARREHDNA